MDADAGVGCAVWGDVGDGLAVGDAVEEGVALDHATVGDGAEAWREGERLGGQVEFEDVVRSGGGSGRRLAFADCRAGRSC